VQRGSGSDELNSSFADIRRTRALRGWKRSSEHGITPTSMVERQRLGSVGWPPRARLWLSYGDPGEADGVAASSLELDGDP
jgi:hypothetical protein